MKTSMQSGITLIELMVALAIIAILAAIAIPAYNNYILNARMAECVDGALIIQIAQEEFFMTNNRYFDGVGAAQLENNSTGLYTRPAAIIAGTGNCEFDVTVGSTGNINTSYTISYRGQNDLTGHNGNLMNN